jgi:hypothetical protein
MPKMTIKDKFFQLMQARGFTIVDDIQGELQLVPHLYKTDQGVRRLISGMRFVVFGGSNVPDGGLGCVVFYFSGVEKKKYCRNSHQTEILKKTGCYKTAKEVIAVYDKWSKDTKETMSTWQMVM